MVQPDALFKVILQHDSEDDSPEAYNSVLLWSVYGADVPVLPS